MPTTPISDTLTQITVWGFVNAYLVAEDDGFTLVDTTVARHGSTLLAAARAGGRPIRRIALTHGHGDHVGSLDELRSALGDEVQVLMPERDAQIHAGEAYAEKKPSGSWPSITTVPDVRLRAGDRVGSLEVIDSPGHTPGHVAFRDTRDDTLLAGDVFASIGRLEVSNHAYWRFPLPRLGTNDPARDLASARALRAIEPRRLALGHGRVLDAPTAAMDAAIARASR